MNKDELIRKLKSSKGKYSSELTDYLESLINLEESVASSKFLTDNIRKKLKSDDLYDAIKTYNVYYKTLKLLDDNNIDYHLISNDIEKLKLIHNYNNYNMLLYSSSFDLVKGQIDLYEYFYNRRERINELDRVVAKLNEEYKKTNPYSNYNELAKINWEVSHKAHIYSLESLYKRLSNFEITDEIVYKMELSNKVTKLFLESFDLEYKDFKDILPKKEDEYLIKTLQLKKEDLNINRNILFL